MESLAHKLLGVRGMVDTRPTQDEFVGVNYESRQAYGLVAWFPLWNGAGAPEIDLVGGLVGQPTNTLDAWDPYMGRVYYGDGGKPAGGSNLPSIARNIEVLPYPFSLDFGKNTDVPTPPWDNPKPFSISIWFMTTWSLQAGAAGEGQYFMSFDNASGAFPGYSFSTLPPVLADNTWLTLEHNIDSAGAQTSMYSHVKSNDGIWHHAVFVYDWDVPTQNITEQRTYMDGGIIQTQIGGDVNGGNEVLVPLESGIGRSHVGVTHFYIGADDDGISGGFAGYMCDMRIYNRALTSGDVLAMYSLDTRWELYRPNRRAQSIWQPPIGFTGRIPSSYVIYQQDYPVDAYMDMY